MSYKSGIKVMPVQKSYKFIYSLYRVVYILKKVTFQITIVLIRKLFIHLASHLTTLLKRSFLTLFRKLFVPICRKRFLLLQNTFKDHALFVPVLRSDICPEV